MSSGAGNLLESAYEDPNKLLGILPQCKSVADAARAFAVVYNENRVLRSTKLRLVVVPSSEPWWSMGESQLSVSPSLALDDQIKVNASIAVVQGNGIEVIGVHTWGSFIAHRGEARACLACMGDFLDWQKANASAGETTSSLFGNTSRLLWLNDLESSMYGHFDQYGTRALGGVQSTAPFLPVYEDCAPAGLDHALYTGDQHPSCSLTPVFWRGRSAIHALLDGTSSLLVAGLAFIQVDVPSQTPRTGAAGLSLAPVVVDSASTESK